MRTTSEGHLFTRISPLELPSVRLVHIICPFWEEANWYRQGLCLSYGRVYGDRLLPPIYIIGRVVLASSGLCCESNEC